MRTWDFDVVHGRNGHVVRRDEGFENAVGPVQWIPHAVAARVNVEVAERGCDHFG